MKKLKAYMVREDSEGNCAIEFATNNATARRNGAGQLNTDWEAIESCQRAPAFDSYAPGPVPPLVLIANGWWFECVQCGRRVSKDEYGDDDEPEILTPEPHGMFGVFCGPACSAKHHAEHRANKHARADMAELFEARWPGATIKRVHVYGQQLEASKPHGGILCSVSFTFPGAKHGATWIYGEGGTAHVAQEDVDAFKAWSSAFPRAGL